MKLANAERGAGDDLKRRILSVFPAGHYALDAFFRLVDIVLTKQVSSAAVECVAAPQLLVNPTFLEQHCRADEHLFMLVMHELHHVLLGHTRLFPRATPLDNIIFDAVINAVLCQLFPAEEYWSFFTNLYRADRIPDALLRPPIGWPQAFQFPTNLPEPIQQAVRTLYSPAGGTYKELYDLFRDNPDLGALAGEGENQASILLGDHSPEGTPHRGAAAAHHPTLIGAVRAIVEKWPQPPNPIRGRSVGQKLRQKFLKLGDRQPSAERVLGRLIRQTVVARPSGGVTKRSRTQKARMIESPVPTLRDRRAMVQLGLGATPLIFRQTVHQSSIDIERGVTHLYLDVSGSTQPYWKICAAIVSPFVKKKLIRLFGFSEEVAEISPAALAKGRIQTTGGTDANCIWQHAIDQKVEKILIITDGYVGRPTPTWRRRITEAKLMVFVALTPDGYRPDLAPIANSLTELPLI